ncbi:MAG: SDR family oxidoreductase [Anaerolineae bacterium]|nr:SDR family oxidoreductase [Anaerolineae bacterium]
MLVPNRFQNRVAVITGGASGIGEGIARRIGQEGGQVVLFDISADSLQRAAAAMQAQKIKVDTAVVDVGDEESVITAFQTVVQRYGQLDIMVNCAGIAGPTSVPILDYPADDFDRVIRVNLRGAYLSTKYAVKHMLPRGYGRILHMASMGGKDGNPGMVGYASSKAGLMGLVKGIGKEYAEAGITVNGLAPAVIRTPMNEDTAPEMLEYMIAKIPMRRLGTVDEVASLACWIVSEEASFNTGFIFDLSGGRATY